VNKNQSLTRRAELGQEIHSACEKRRTVEKGTAEYKALLSHIDKLNASLMEIKAGMLVKEMEPSFRPEVIELRAENAKLRWRLKQSQIRFTHEFISASKAVLDVYAYVYSGHATLCSCALCDLKKAHQKLHSFREAKSKDCGTEEECE